MLACHGQAEDGPVPQRAAINVRGNQHEHSQHRVVVTVPTDQAGGAHEL
jgi:hypothetical protein